MIQTVENTDANGKVSEFNRCYICNSVSLHVLKKYHATGLVKCQSCGFVFSKWIPSDQFLIEFYNKYPEYQHWNNITTLRYRKLLEAFEKYRVTNNLLEVGSGEGFFLDEARAKNWKVFGTEFIDRFIERCRERGMIMHRGKLDVSNYPSDSLDIIIWIEVIEHINNPTEELQKFKRLLRPGGIVYLTTPNFNSLSRIILGEKLNLISYPNHLAYYTPSTLRKLFELNGFKKVSISTTGISPGRIVSTLKRRSTSQDIILNSETQKIDEPLREKIESNSFLKFSRNMVNAFLTMTGSGEALKGIFIKKD